MSRVLPLAFLENSAYIDFEGRTDEQPILLGVLLCTDGELCFRQYLLDERFHFLADMKATTLVASLETALEFIPADHRVYAWSSHEEKMLQKYLPATGAELWANRVTNAIPIARRWSRSLPASEQPVRQAGRGTHTLDQYMRIAGYRVPTVHGPLKTGTRIALFESLIDRGRPYQSWTKGQKSHWTKFLNHNRHDCFGLKSVLEHIAR
jgi:hypothetical protein